MGKLPEFILLPFFNRLRKSTGMELDMTQYYLFLELFMKGHARDKDSLLTLCKTLWLTQAKFRDSFERWFEEAYQGLNDCWLPELQVPVDERISPVPEAIKEEKITGEGPIKDLEIEDISKKPAHSSEAPGKTEQDAYGRHAQFPGGRQKSSDFRQKEDALGKGYGIYFFR